MYARICIEIGIDCDILEAILVVLDERKAYLLLVEYNWKPYDVQIVVSSGTQCEAL